MFSGVFARGIQICQGSWKLQTFFYLFLIHSVFVYLEAIKFVGTLILAISVESLLGKSGLPEYSREEAHHQQYSSLPETIQQFYSLV